MASCPSCGKELPGEFPFCPFCAAPLIAQPAPSLHEERKVVTVLFCDLVGFTAASDAADPEDVRARMLPYYARLRSEIERYGGTVEKFIGDAVMAVFGAPVAHEDDAERAVRAGLRILEAIEELNAEDPRLDLRVRIGINTGEVVVSLGASPDAGEAAVLGDAVNTASRLQTAAPVNGIACSEQTYRATERVFLYDALEPVQVKGKTGLLAVFRPLEPRARFGTDVAPTHAAPLVGREHEKLLLLETFERSAKQRSCQLVTVVGEPGVGKSRLCAELFSYLEDRPGLVRWRQGRCLPYGEGIAFWALGEIVKAEYGILESDSSAETEAKLERALPGDDLDRGWLKARFAPLVGMPAEPAAREELFAAWRRSIESWAETRETVLVFEDLHWADDALLTFLEYLADSVQGVPLLLLCTARPELYQQRTFGASARNAQRINLAPLTEDETARLLAFLLETAVLPADTQRALLERAGGNPLYAEEFVRLLSDRGRLDEVDMPGSVQALIAARLDTLTRDHKSVLQDAAVVGKVFWAGALAEMGGRGPEEVEQALHELARKELVRPARSSSMDGETEYGFRHLLVRDVCYQQIPRAARAARHRAAAAWIERKAGERVEDLADVLAHHSLSALELTRAAGQSEQTEELEASARRHLALAGERALALDVDRAEQSLARALQLTPPGHGERALLLERWAEAAQQQGRLREVRDALEEALAAHRKQGGNVAAGRVLTALANLLARLGDPHAEETLAEALALLEAEPPGPELVAAYAQQAFLRWLVAGHVEAIEAAERALALAAALGEAEPARALGIRGGARSSLGERQGLEDMRRALALALAQGQSREAAVLHNNLALASWEYEGPRAALAACREGIDFSERRGIAELTLAIAAMSTTFLAELGEAAHALAEAEPLAERLEAAGDLNFIEPRAVQLRLLAERGAQEHAPSPDAVLAAARASGLPEKCIGAIAAAARLLLAQGKPGQAQALLAELEQLPGTRGDPYYTSNLPGFVRTALALADAELAARLVDGVAPLTPLAQHALAVCSAQLAEAGGDRAKAAARYGEAAQRWREFGNVPESANALLGRGRCLAALAGADAKEPLREARELFASMGYKPALAEADALLGEGEAATV